MTRSAIRPFCTLSPVLTAAWLLVAPGCGTDATGVEACRQVERARCRAAAACGIVEDAEACERFYRDHCLHGLRGSTPSDRELEACVRIIGEAGECAASQSDSAACAGACDIVDAPERAPECVFLDPDSEEAEDDDEEPTDAGGTGGTEASAGAPAEDDEPAGAGGTAAD